MATLKITRRREFINLVRNFRIYLNGQKLGTISSGETVEYDIPDGTHDLCSKIDWCGSQNFQITLKDTETKCLTISGAKYGNLFMIITLLLFPLLSLLFRTMKLEYRLLVFLPYFLGILYILTIGRNNYLVIEESPKHTE